jgi:hypothetical protein
MTASSRKVGASPFWLVFPLGESTTVVPGLTLEIHDAAVLDERSGFVGVIRRGLPRVFDLGSWFEFVEACKAAKTEMVQ